MLKRDYRPDPDGDWFDRILILWVQDDVPYIDRETTEEALTRFTGWRGDISKRVLAEVDEGDSFTKLLQDGWVRVSHCEGGSIGVVVKREEQR